MSRGNLVLVIRVGVLGIVAIAAGALALDGAGAAGPRGGARGSTDHLISLNFKFSGAGSCSASDCHGAHDAKEKGLSFSNEYTLWSGDKDPHHRAYATLEKPQSVKIAKELKIADAAKSERCLSCHSLNVPATLKGQKFNLKEGVTCNACHGPSEKWLQPHSHQGWLVHQAQGKPHELLLKETGLFDTRPIEARAQQCTGCHLKIDADMVAAGHPQPTFEMNWFSTIYDDRHWHDPDGYFAAQLWAGGQVIAVHDAMGQLAERAQAAKHPELIKQAHVQAMAYYSVFNQLFASGVLKGGETLAADVAKIDAGMKASKFADVAAAAQSAMAHADALGTTVAAFNPTKASDIKLFNAVLSERKSIEFGERGIDQQRDAVFAIYTALATSKDKPADADAVLDLISKMFPEGGVPSAADFKAVLAAVKAKAPR